MFADLSEGEREQLRDLINRLLTTNFLVKAVERERYLQARRLQSSLAEFFHFLGWEFILDDQHECIAVIPSDPRHLRRLTREESIWLLILRLIYQEKREGLSLAEFPVTTLHEIRAKYQTFRLPLFNKTRFGQLVQLGIKYSLLQPLDEDLQADDCRFRLFHTLLHALSIEGIERIGQRLLSYQGTEEGKTDEAP
ncbi:MAG: DUF4194 domain-containing protein [Bacillota bacterium]